MEKKSTTSSEEKKRTIQIQTSGEDANKLAGVLKYLLESVGAEVQLCDPNDSVGKHFREAVKNHVDLTGMKIDVSGLVRTTPAKRK